MTAPPAPAPAPDPEPPRVANSILLGLSERLIRVLPPAFLLLIVMNCMFLGVIAWVFNHAAETRAELLTKIVERCLLHPS